MMIRKVHPRLMAAFAVAATLGLSALGGSYEWTGGGDGASWDSAANWGGSGIPGAGDTVTINGGTGLDLVIPDGGVQIAKVASIAGVVTFSGGRLTVCGDVEEAYRFDCVSGATITFKNAFEFGRHTFRPRLYNGTTLNHEGGIFGAGYWAPAQGGTINIRGVACEIGTVSTGGGGATYNFYVPVTSGRAEFAAMTTVNFYTNVFDTTGYFYFSHSMTQIHLHGFDQSFGSMIFAAGAIDTDAPATISFAQTMKAATNDTCNWSGPLSFRMTSESTKEYALNRSVDSSGGLEVGGGEFAFAENAVWQNIAYMRLCGGKVRIPAGKTVLVPALYLGDSKESLDDGPYTAQTHPDYIAGGGTVLVKQPAAETVPLTWDPRQEGGDLAVAANWAEKPDSVPLRTGGLLATFATSGAEATSVDAVKMKGVVFEAPGDFRLDVISLQLGSEGIVARGAHNYTVDSPVSVAAVQTWSVEMGAHVFLPEPVGSLMEDCSITKTGAGSVSLTGVNTFNVDLTIMNGRVDITNNAALGTGTADLRKTVTVKQASGGGLILPGGVLQKHLRFEGNDGYSFKENEAGVRFEGSNTVQGVFTVTGTGRPSLKWGAFVEFAGGVDGNNAGLYPFAYGGTGGDGNPQMRFSAVVGNVAISPNAVDLSYEVPSNRVSRIEISRGNIHARVPYAWTRTDAYVNPVYGSMIDLHGNDQIVGTLIMSGADKGYGITSGSEGPATLYITQNHANYAARTNTVGDLKGQLSIVMGGPYASYHDNALSTCGDLTVTNGTFAFLEHGSWLNGTNFTVTGVSDSCKGRISIASSTTFGKHAVVRLGGKGVLELAAGVVQRCRELYLADGNGNYQAAASGTWGGVGSGAQHIDEHFAGAGLLNVRGIGLAIIVR